MPSRRVQSRERSDAELIVRVRRHDQAAFAELYRRHHCAARAAARGFPSIDADDLVDEAFLRVVTCIRRGKGPRDAFRPYLYRTVHNVAIDWVRASSNQRVADDREWQQLDAEHADAAASEPVETALDHTLTARAYRSLPERWQAVLWYTEVEGLDPHEVAPLLRLTPNGVAALAYRARDGLRTAWLQAHVATEGLSGTCRWAAERTGRGARGSLRDSEARRLREHRRNCARCAILAEEVDDLSARLSLVVVPLVLGSVAGAAWAATRRAADLSVVAAPSAPPAVPDATLLASVAAGGTATSAGIGTVLGVAAPALLIGGLVVASVAVTSYGTPPTSSSTSAISSSDGDGRDSAGPETVQADRHSASPDRDDDDPATTHDEGADERDVDGDLGDLGEAASGVEREVDVVREVVDAALSTIVGDSPPPGHSAPGGVVGADVTFDLGGTATPGATLSLQGAGQVYATTTVAADGTFSLHATALPAGTQHLDLVQAVDRAYLQRLLPDSGALIGGLLGSLDDAVDALITPASIVTQSVAGIIIDVGTVR